MSTSWAFDGIVVGQLPFMPQRVDDSSSALLALVIREAHVLRPDDHLRDLATMPYGPDEYPLGGAVQDEAGSCLGAGVAAAWRLRPDGALTHGRLW
jgi:hypothetical protein